VNLVNGLLNLTNWVGNVIMPTVAGLFAAAAVFHFSKGRHFHQYAYVALASLMCSGLLRALETFSNQAAWNNPDRFCAGSPGNKREAGPAKPDGHG